MSVFPLRRWKSMPLLSVCAPAPFEEACRMLCDRITVLFSKPSVRLVVSSALPGEGKTTVAVNLAIALAQKGKRVLLLETDFRHPVLAERLRMGHAPPGGLSEVLEGKAPPAANTVFFTDLGFYLLPAGSPHPDAAQAVSSAKLGNVLDALEKEYDWLLLDSPPACLYGDAGILGRAADGVLLVLRQGRTPEERLRNACEGLEQAGARVVGGILNDCRRGFC